MSGTVWLIDGCKLRMIRWSLKVHLGVLLFFFFVYYFGGKEVPSRGNLGLNLSPLCIGKSEDIQPESAPLFKGKVSKKHKYKRCAAVSNFPTDLGKKIHERGRKQRLRKC